MNEDQIVDIWLGLKEYFDKKQLETIAAKYVDVLADNGIEDHVFKSVLGVDDDLDHAIEYYLEEGAVEDDDVESDNGDFDYIED